MVCLAHRFRRRPLTVVTLVWPHGLQVTLKKSLSTVAEQTYVPLIYLNLHDFT